MGLHGQVFDVRHMREKHPAKEKDAFYMFMDLEKAYDTIDWHGMWQSRECQELEWNCWKQLKSFYGSV